MSVDPQGNELGKLFVGGLHQSTTNESLKSYFSKFGDIEESVVMMDSRTGRSRGFGYVKFKSDSSVDWVLNQKPHLIDLKEVDPKRCNVNMKGKNRRSLKVFVGGIAFDHDEAAIRSFFSKYGKVTDVNLLTSPNKLRHRGFAFVGFEDEELVKNLIRLRYLDINGKRVEIKAMKPPNLQKVDYPVSPGGPTNTQLNGRAVRGVRVPQFNLPQSNGSYPWNQWPGNWNAHGPLAQSSQPWPHPINWGNAATGGGTNQQHAGPTGTGTGPPLSGLAPMVGNWSDPPMGPSNGWVPQNWNNQVTGPNPSNRIHSLNEDGSVFNHQQRKPHPNWDQSCLNPLNTGPATVQNSIDAMKNLTDAAWTDPNSGPAAFCQLAPPSMGSTYGMAGPPGPNASWNHGTTPPTSVNAHWASMDGNPMAGRGPNSGPIGAGAAASGIAGGFLSDPLTAPHQNGTALAAIAAAAANNVNNSTNYSPLSHWANTGALHPSGLKFNDSMHIQPAGCSISTHAAPNNNPINLPHSASVPCNGLMSGDWHALAANNMGVSAASFHPPLQSQQMYKR